MAKRETILPGGREHNALAGWLGRCTSPSIALLGGLKKGRRSTVENVRLPFLVDDGTILTRTSANGRGSITFSGLRDTTMLSHCQSSGTIEVPIAARQAS